MVRKYARPYESCLTLLSDIMVCLRCTLYVSNSNTVSSGTCKITWANKPLSLMRLLCASLVANEYVRYFTVHKIRPLSPVRLSLQLHVVQHFNVCLKKYILRAAVWKLFINNCVMRDFPHTYKGTITNDTVTIRLPKGNYKPNC